MRDGRFRRPRRFTRPFAVFALCLVLGALTTIIVAWTFALNWSPGSIAWFRLPTHWPHPAPPDWNAPDKTEAFLRFGTTSHVGSRIDPTYPNFMPVQELVRLRMYGLPFRAMSDVQIERHVGTTVTDYEVGTIRGGVNLHGAVAGSGTIRRRLPLMPVWPGFALDVVFYTLVWHALLLIPLLAWRRVRRHFGHCPRCGYDLHGVAADAPCPECGSAKPRPRG